ncbi:MAG TPA: superoxide dismutase [Candidatus Acidoferrales bacterium]|nr:superoxide dismutase [Candidatus Acidoferrales bacterium]
MELRAYKPKEFKLSGLQGISDETLEIHFKLYEGYVKNTNLLTDQLLEMVHQRKALTSNPAYSEIKRHLGFEYGGMVLHEYYFGNLAPKGAGSPAKELIAALDQSFGNFESWRTDFTAVGNMRGVGWAVLYHDPVTERLSNHWIELHQQGVPSGFKPLLVMDVWEHAYLRDYKPSEKAKYIDAFFANVNWDAVNEAFRSAEARRPTG